MKRKNTYDYEKENQKLDELENQTWVLFTSLSWFETFAFVFGYGLGLLAMYLVMR